MSKSKSHNKKESVLGHLKKSTHQKKENKNPKVYIEGRFNRVKISSSLLKLSSFYSIQKIWLKLLIITIVCILSGIIGDLLLQNTGLYTVGIEAFAQGFARLLSYFFGQTISDKELIRNILFWGLIIVVNIPLLIFGWFKVGKSFTLYSTYYVIVSSLFGLGFGFIHGVQEIYLLADTSNIISQDNFVQIVPWDSKDDATSQLSLFIYGIIFGIIQAILYAVLFILDCSSAGLDMIIVWYAEKKHKNIGTIFTYFNILCFIFSYILGTYVPASLTFKDNPLIPSLNESYTEHFNESAWNISLLLSPNFIATLLMSLILGMTLNSFFPKYQMSRIEIVTRKVEEIRDELINNEKPYSLSIKTIEGGYSRLPQKTLVTNCTYIEAPNILRIVRKYDPNALFILTLIKNIDGYIYFKSNENEKIELKFFSWIKKIFKRDIDKNTDRKIEFGIGDKIISEDPNAIEEKTILENNKIDNQEKKLGIIEASEVYDELESKQ